MKKALYIGIMTLLCHGQSSAQFLIGPQAGANFATLTGTSLSVNAKPGWHIGAFMSIPFSKHVSIMPALLYVVDGYKYDYTTTTTTTAQPSTDTTITTLTTLNANVDATLGHLDLPVLLNYFAGETKGLMIQAGLQLSFLIVDNSTVSTTTTTTVSINGGNPTTTPPTEPSNQNNISLTKANVSIVGGVGYKFSQLLILYTRVVTGLAKQQEGGFVKDADSGHIFSFEGGIALSFGAK